VPTGQDQKQHVEFARDIAQKFNTNYGETFVLPDSYIQKEVAVIPGIDGRKMSKSYKNFIGMLDDEKTISKKVKQIATDATPIQDPKNPDTCNVFNIMKLFLTSEEEVYRRKRYTDGGLSYKDAKDALFEKVRAFVTPIQEKYNAISDASIIALLAKNATRAHAIASKKIDDVYKKVGFSL